MRSQRNFDLKKPQGGRLDLLDFPFKVRNPDLVPHALDLDPTIYGIDPFWEIKFLTDPGDPPPDVLQPGETVNLHMLLVPAVQKINPVLAAAPAQAPQQLSLRRCEPGGRGGAAGWRADRRHHSRARYLSCDAADHHALGVLSFEF